MTSPTVPLACGSRHVRGVARAALEDLDVGVGPRYASAYVAPARHTPDKGEGPANEYESFVGPFCSAGLVAAMPTTRFPDQPRTHRAAPRIEVLSTSRSVVLPRFPLAGSA